MNYERLESELNILDDDETQPLEDCRLGDSRLEIVAMGKLDNRDFDVKRTFINFDPRFMVTRLQNTFKLYCNTELNATIKGYVNFIGYLKYVCVMIEDDWKEVTK